MTTAADTGRTKPEVAAVLVPGRRGRPDNPARCAAAVRRSHGATTVQVATNHVAMVSHPDEVLQRSSSRRPPRRCRP
jgi:hypothetical protein